MPSYGSSFNNTIGPIYRHSGSIGMHGNNVRNANPGGNVYNAPNYPPMGTQPGDAPGLNQYNPAPPAPLHPSFGAW